MSQAKSVSQATVRNTAVQILDQQTIRKVQNVCEALIEERTLPHFEDFVRNQSDFILTERRYEILSGVQSRLANEESAGVVLHGSYGSGKTVLMKSIADLCEGPQVLHGKELPQITFGDSEIDCFKFSLQEHDSAAKLLKAIYQSFLNSPNLTEEDLLEIYKEKKTALSLDAYDRLPPNTRSQLNTYFDDPESLSQLAEAVKSLSAPDAVETISWFGDAYHDAEGVYPALYIDEFEQVFRHLGQDEETQLKLIVKRMLRRATTEFEEREQPPFILFVNSVGLGELQDVINAQDDLINRIRQGISYEIDLSKQETKHLFKELYHLYITPLLEDYQDAVPEWHEAITTAAPDDEAYAYPFTESALELALDVADSSRDESRDESVVKAFRAYKSVLMGFFETWNGEGLIDDLYLYEHGDEVRQLIGNLERADLSRIPGRKSIQDRINDDFDSESRVHRRILSGIAEAAILDRDDHPTFFSPDEVQEIANKNGVDITIEETDFISEVGTHPAADYLEVEDNHLLLNQHVLTGAAVTDETRGLEEIIQEVTEERGLHSASLLKWWETYLSEQASGKTKIKDQGDFLEIDVPYDYTAKVYFTQHKGIPSQLSTNTSSNALEFVIAFGEAEEDDELPARFYTAERNGRAEEIVDDIETALNDNLRDSLNEDEPSSTLIENIKKAFPGRTDYAHYTLFLKFSLLDILNEDLPEDIRDRTGPSRLFSILRFVKTNLDKRYQSYVPDRLGFNDDYSGTNLLTLAYGIQYLKEHETLQVETSDDYEIRRTFPSYGQVDMRKLSNASDFEEVIKEFTDEPFIAKTDNGYEVYPSPSSTMKNILETVEDALHDNGGELNFDEVVETIFGTTNIENVAKAYVYLMLSFADLYEERFILSAEETGKIVEPSRETNRLRQRAKSHLEEAIQREAILQARNDNSSIKQLQEIKDKLEQVESADPTNLEQWMEEFTTETDTDVGKVEERLRSLGAEQELASTDVGEYITHLKNVGSAEATLLFLIQEDLDHLVTQLEGAATVLEEQAVVEDYSQKIGELTGTRPDLDSTSLQIVPVDKVSTHLQSHDVQSKIDDPGIAANFEDFKSGDLDADELVSQLKRVRLGIVPQVESYDADSHLEKIEEEKAALERQYGDLQSKEQKKIEQAEAQLENYRPQIPEGEETRVRHAERVLENWGDEIEQSLNNLDADQCTSFRDSWQKQLDQLANVVIEEEDIQEILDSFGLGLDLDAVIDSNGDPGEVIETFDKEALSTVLQILDEEKEPARQLQAALVKQHLHDNGGGDE